MTRLASIDPAAVAREVVGWAADHLSILATSLSNHSDLALPDEWSSTDIGLAAYVLAHYAQTGDAPTDAPVREHLKSVALLWTVAHPGSVVTPPWELRVPSLATSLDLVLTAVTGREAIAAGDDVSTSQLAALAGITYESARKQGMRRELDVHDGHVTAAEARRWLRARGVPGI